MPGEHSWRSLIEKPISTGLARLAQQPKSLVSAVGIAGLTIGYMAGRRAEQMFNTPSSYHSWTRISPKTVEYAREPANFPY